MRATWIATCSTIVSTPLWPVRPGPKGSDVLAGGGW